jgi:hypothetical protein
LLPAAALLFIPDSRLYQSLPAAALLLLIPDSRLYQLLPDAAPLLLAQLMFHL